MFFDVEEFFWKGENSEKAFCADEFSFSTNTSLVKDSVNFRAVSDCCNVLSIPKLFLELQSNY